MRRIHLQVALLLFALSSVSLSFFQSFSSADEKTVETPPSLRGCYLVTRATLEKYRKPGSLLAESQKVSDQDRLPLRLLALNIETNTITLFITTMESGTTQKITSFKEFTLDRVQKASGADRSCEAVVSLPLTSQSGETRIDILAFPPNANNIKQRRIIATLRFDKNQPSLRKHFDAGNEFEAYEFDMLRIGSVD